MESDFLTVAAPALICDTVFTISIGSISAKETVYVKLVVASSFSDVCML